MSAEQVSPLAIPQKVSEAFELQNDISNAIYYVTSVVQVLCDCAHNFSLAEECDQHGVLSAYAIENTLYPVLDKFKEIEQKADRLWDMQKASDKSESKNLSDPEKVLSIYNMLSSENKQKVTEFMTFLVSVNKNN